jgi:hypothetical protein
MVAVGDRGVSPQAERVPDRNKSKASPTDAHLGKIVYVKLLCLGVL